MRLYIHPGVLREGRRRSWTDSLSQIRARKKKKETFLGSNVAPFLGWERKKKRRKREGGGERFLGGERRVCEGEGEEARRLLLLRGSPSFLSSSLLHLFEQHIFFSSPSFNTLKRGRILSLLLGQKSMDSRLCRNVGISPFFSPSVSSAGSCPLSRPSSSSFSSFLFSSSSLVRSSTACRKRPLFCGCYSFAPVCCPSLSHSSSPPASLFPPSLFLPSSSFSSSSSSFQRRFTRRSVVMEEDFDGPLRSGKDAKEDRHAWFDAVHPLPPGGPSWMNRYYGYLGRIRSQASSSADTKPTTSRDRTTSSSSSSSSSPPPTPPSLSKELDWNSRRLFLAGHVVPYKFRITDIPASSHGHRPPSERLGILNRQTDPTLEYTDFSQNRFPVLNTAENFRYWKDRGLDRLLPRVFPIKLPAHRRIDPLLREYIYFLHSLDPARFSERKLGERYGLRERTVQLVLREFSVGEFLRRKELATPTTRRLSREKSILKAKEILFGTKLGFDQLGDEDLDEQEENVFKGFRSTEDWVQRQHIEVEMMSAFPLPAKRDALPKRVDVDLTVRNTRKMKIINWIDPTDKVVF